MDNSESIINELKEKIEKLEIELDFSKNELFVAKEEFINTSQKYLLSLSEIQSKNEELEKLAKIAASANDSKNVFLANVGHEFRTPLNAIVGFSDILLNQKDLTPEDQQNYIATIHKRTQDLLRLVNDLMDVSKIEAGKISLVYETHKFKRAINEIAHQFSEEIKNKKLDYNINIDRHIPKFLNIDKLRLRQILTNLIGNSVKFTNKGYITLDVFKTNNKNIADNKIELEFIVSDTGIGIPKHQQHQLFKPFSQVQNSSFKQYGGTGLGLAISKKLVEMMEGKIWIEDNFPSGIKFCFTIVVKRNENKIFPKIEQQSFETVSKKILERRPINLLIVEDDEPSARVVKIVLNCKSKNLKITTVDDGQKGVEEYKKGIVEMILTDIQMPNMDGMAMIQQIRSLEKNTNKHIPIIAMTAFALQEDKDRCIAAGADNYLPKPIIRSELYNVIDKTIDQFFKINEQ